MVRGVPEIHFQLLRSDALVVSILILSASIDRIGDRLPIGEEVLPVAGLKSEFHKPSLLLSFQMNGVLRGPSYERCGIIRRTKSG